VHSDLKSTSLLAQIAVFWDYENVPFQHANREALFVALQSFMTSMPIQFGKVYNHNKYAPDVYARLQKIPNLKIKQVNSSEPNAVDENLIQSCQSVIAKYPEITHVVLISGDHDYHVLVSDLKARNIKIILVSYANCSKELRKKVHFPISINKILHAPTQWWSHIFPSPKKYERKFAVIEKFIPVKKPTLNLNHTQWNALIDYVEYLFQHEFRQNGTFILNSIQITYAIRNSLELRDVILNNYGIYLVIKIFGIVGLLLEIYADTWNLASNSVQDRAFYIEKCISEALKLH
jgi:hypothetical protein